MLIGVTGFAEVKNGQTCESVERRPVMLMTQKFALPRPSQSRINESASQSTPRVWKKRR